MTPFSTALNVAGGMKQSTPNAIFPKPQVQSKVVQPTVPASSFKKKSNVVTKQVSDYGKAMNQAIKNTNSY